jgi:hypothetical protein
MKVNKMRIALRLGLVAATLLVVWDMAMAQNDQVKGVINGRSGATMSVLSQGGESITVVLTTDTQVLEPEGVFRKKHLTMTALVPGLAVEVNGSFNDSESSHFPWQRPEDRARHPSWSGSDGPASSTEPTTAEG